MKDFDKEKDKTALDEFFGPVISIYSRAQAIADGILVDVSSMALEAGFKLPVAITRAAWKDCVEWSEQDNSAQVYQDESGRLWDVLFMAYYAICTSRETGDRLHFSLYRVPKDGSSAEAEEVSLKLIVGPGDSAESVVTILLPDES
ncbi:MAG: hypothetical protein OXE78_07165 [Gammaproteobacteria bacterium]|nr:hypothetical protein [Gammaproteobacteria bacterium]